MIVLLLLGAIDRADTAIDAQVSEDLSTVRMHVVIDYLPATPKDEVAIVLGAERFRGLPPSFAPVRQRELFRASYQFGGLDVSNVKIDGKACAPREEVSPDGARRLYCPIGQVVELDAVLSVPERYGAFGRHANQLVLGGGWYPFIARGRVRMNVRAPPGHQQIGPTETENAQLPLLVVPANVHPRSISEGRAFLFAQDHETLENEEVARTVREALTFLEEENIELPDRERPWVVLVAALRHELAVATRGPTLVSDRAFRMLPFERFLRFHRFPIIRALYTGAFLERFGDRPTAEAAAAWLTERFVRSRVGRAEDAFDVLGFWSFIPAIDLLLYAPDVPFEAAYFKRVDDSDPLSPNLIDFPTDFGSGRVVFEKLADRLGAKRTDVVFQRVVHGASLKDAIAPELGLRETEQFLATWLAPYPSVRYRLASWSSEDNTAKVIIERDGAAVKEPVQVRLVDDNDKERVLFTETTSAAVRVLTATMSAPLSSVELDPFGRLIETPTRENPSPRFDNRSSPRWKVLLNNWNISLGATAGTIDTALDVGFSKQYDVRWRYAVRADYDPAAISGSTRMSYSFGESVTRSRLLQAIGGAVEGAYLRPEFGDTTQSAFAAAARVYWSYDDRASYWAAEPGTSLSATLEYSHVFGTVIEQLENGAPRMVSQDALSLSLRAGRSWRFFGSQQLSLRASAGAFLFGDPRTQILFPIGGRANVRGYPVDAVLGEVRAIAGAEWVHPILPELNENGFFLWWVTGMDGALFVDGAIIADDLSALGHAPFLADVGYGVRLYLDYFGVRPGVMAVDVAVPLVDIFGHRDLGDPQVYIDFSQSF